MKTTLTMTKIKVVLTSMKDTHERIAALNKELRNLRSSLKEYKEKAQTYMVETDSTCLDVGSHLIEIKDKPQKPTLNKDNQNKWLTEYLSANDMDATHAPKIVEFFEAKIKEEATTKKYLSFTKNSKAKKRKRKKEESPEPTPEPEVVENSIVGNIEDDHVL